MPPMTPLSPWLTEKLRPERVPRRPLVGESHIPKGNPFLVLLHHIGKGLGGFHGGLCIQHALHPAGAGRALVMLMIRLAILISSAKICDM